MSNSYRSSEITKAIADTLQQTLMAQYNVPASDAALICKAFFSSRLIEVTSPERFSPNSEDLYVNRKRGKIITVKPGNIIFRFWHGSESNIEKAIRDLCNIASVANAWNNLTHAADLSDVVFGVVLPCLATASANAMVELPANSIKIIEYLYKRNCTSEYRAIALEELYEIYASATSHSRKEFDDIITTLLQWRSVANSSDGNKLWLTEEVHISWS